MSRHGKKPSRFLQQVFIREWFLDLIKDFGTDSVINAGGGIHGHPDGAKGGAKAFRSAVEAVLTGKALSDAAYEDEALSKALELWGGFKE